MFSSPAELTIIGAEQEGFIAKYDASGNLHWARQIGTIAGDVAWSVSADGQGSVFVAGETFGNLGALNGGSADAFLGKYDAAGNVLWIQQLGGSGFDYAEGVFSDKFGNAYVVGETEGSLGGPNAGGYDAFVAKYDPAGNQLWFNQFGTATTDYALSVSGDALGNIFTGGVTDGSLGGTKRGQIRHICAEVRFSGKRTVDATAGVFGGRGIQLVRSYRCVRGRCRRRLSFRRDHRQSGRTKCRWTVQG
jgi:hypothetical protein